MALVTSVVGIPIDCTGQAAGCERAPQAYRDAGLITALNVPDNGDLPVVLNDPERDAAIGIIGFEQLVSASETIRVGVRDLLHAGEKPLVLGGCCSLLIGIAAALRDLYGRAGLAFIDGHIDYYDGQNSPTGESSDMELAILTGYGPSRLTELAGEAPLIFPSDVTAIGVRDLDEARQHGSAAPDPAIRIFEYDPAKDNDVLADLGKQTASRFTAEPGRFWLHLDLDVLSSDAMPAVDYPMPGGFDWEQLRRLIRPLVSSAGFLGMDVTIYNPTLDPDGSCAAKIVDFLSDVLAS
jgi:arginase